MTARQTALDQAAGWVARLADRPDPATQAAFEAWRGASIDNEIAFEQGMAAWERLDGLSVLRPFNGEDIVCPPAIQPPHVSAAPEKGHLAARRSWLAMAASLTLLLGMGAAVLLQADPAEAYATRIGEMRHIRLPDGTRVELNTNTLILVHMRAHRRQVEVVRGEAVFHVNHDARLFSVYAGNLTLQADDADMAVRVETTEAKVIVTRGHVEMSGAKEGLGLGSMTVNPGTIARLTPDMLELQHTPAPEINRQLAWREGVIEFDGQSLSEALSEFNRYNKLQVRLADPTLGTMRIGGYFHDNDLDGFVTAITQTLPLTARRDHDGEIILMLRDASAAPVSQSHTID